MKNFPRFSFYALVACLVFAGCKKAEPERTDTGSKGVFAYDTDSADEGNVFMTHIGEWLKAQGLTAAAPVQGTAGKITVFSGSYHGSQPFQLQVTETPGPNSTVHFVGMETWTVKGTDADIKTHQDKVAEFTTEFQKITGPGRP